ncbi:acyltransferase [Rhizobium sp. NLR22b]|uniref:acyltransferase family protein n=1 Tax=Rhizobium sp. NLR22b TaxID=2731115 RepID=UPI001C838FE8|nr:acyltransferase [Rhizobium sp. NLR22b]MBX5241429.1 acyltransferase [Rhizobium sp. NLR22b]
MVLGEKLDLAKGRPTGFDYMRLLLAFSVLWIHTARVTYGDDLFLWETSLRPFIKSVLPMFFALSGFLVAGSLGRSKTLISFLGNRFIRIYPALAVEVFLAAFILGAIYTEYDLSNYFTDPQFFTYLLNATGHIHFNLPGVFLSNPDAAMVNGQLWTVPFELECYVAIAALFLLGVVRRRVLALIATTALIVGFGLARYWKHESNWASMPTTASGNLLIGAFLVGVTIYLYRDKILWDVRIFIAAVAVILWAYWFSSFGDFVAIPAIGYVTVFLGLTSPRKLGVLQGADYSYGVFLYGYPIQQAFVALGPWAHNWWLNGIVCSIIVTCFAAFSWRFIERPALELRKQVTWLENLYLQRGTRRELAGAVLK